MGTATVAPGVCGECAWARSVVSARGSTFVRCTRHEVDARLPKYPALPRLACHGFEAQEDAGAARPGGDAMRGGAEPLPMRGATLFERVGGRPVVERIVADFYDRVEHDPELRPIFPADLSSGREKQTLFLEQWLGGEPRYSERWGHPRLRMRHFPFVITERAAERWLGHMREAFRAAGVGETEIAEVFAGLVPLARHMVNAGEDVPREPRRDARLT